MPNYDPQLRPEDARNIGVTARAAVQPAVRGWEAIQRAADVLGYEHYKDEFGQDRWVDPKTGESYSSDDLVKVAAEAAGAYSAFGPSAGAGAGGFASRAARSLKTKLPKGGVPGSPGPALEIPTSVQSNLPPQAPPSFAPSAAVWEKPPQLGYEPLPSGVKPSNAATFAGPSGEPLITPPPGGGLRYRSAFGGVEPAKKGIGDMTPALVAGGGVAAAGAGLLGKKLYDYGNKVPGVDGEPPQQAQSTGRPVGQAAFAAQDGQDQREGFTPAPWGVAATQALPAAASLVGRGVGALASQKPAQQAPGRAPARPASAVANAAKGTAALGNAAPSSASTQNVAFSPTGTGGARPNFNYYAEMMNAADAGEAYARDFINLRENARRSAIEAATRDDKFQFVPITDYRNNRVVLVNANGNDVVLDMNDPYHKAEYSRMLDKIGMNPNEMTAWSMRASRPLLRHFQPNAGNLSPDPMPDFGFQPGQAQVGRGGQPQTQEQEPIGMPKTDLGGFVAARKFHNPIKGLYVPGGEPDADQLGGPSDKDADNMPRPSLSVGNLIRSGIGADEAGRRLGAWDYESETPVGATVAQDHPSDLAPFSKSDDFDLLGTKKPKPVKRPAARVARR